MYVKQIAYVTLLEISRHTEHFLKTEMCLSARYFIIIITLEKDGKYASNYSTDNFLHSLLRGHEVGFDNTVSINPKKGVLIMDTYE